MFEFFFGLGALPLEEARRQYILQSERARPSESRLQWLAAKCSMIAIVLLQLDHVEAQGPFRRIIVTTPAGQHILNVGVRSLHAALGLRMARLPMYYEQVRPHQPQLRNTVRREFTSVV